MNWLEIFKILLPVLLKIGQQIGKKKSNSLAVNIKYDNKIAKEVRTELQEVFRLLEEDS